MTPTSLKHKIMAFISMLLLLIVSSTNAEVLGHIEDISLESNVYQQAISPDGKYIFSTTLMPTRLYVHRRNPETGKLQQVQMIEKEDLVPGKTIKSFFPQKIVVSPDSKQLYISSFFGEDNSGTDLLTSDSVIRFDISSNGRLSYHSRIITGAAAELAMSPNGKFMFAGDDGSASIVVIKRASNGNISLVEKVTTDSNGNKVDDTQNITISPDNNYLYASSEFFDGHLYVYQINQSTGKLTGIQTLIEENKASSTFANTEDVSVKGSGGSGTAISKDGKFFYSVGGYGDEADRRSITLFRRNSDGTLSFIKQIQSPDSGNSLGILYAANIDLIFSPNEKYIYTFDSIISSIGVWKRNTANGDLHFIDKIKLSRNSISDNKMHTSKDGKHLYLNADGDISLYDLRSDMDIVKTGPSNVELNSTISYTLAVTNNGPSNAHNVVVTDNLPEGTSFISGTVNSPSGSCSAVGQKVTCTMGVIGNGVNYNAILKVKAPSVKGTITNTASVTADQLDTTVTGNSDSETTNITSDGGSDGGSDGSGNSSGGGSIPVSILTLLSLLFLRRLIAKIKYI